MPIVASFAPSNRDLVWAGYVGMRSRPVFLAVAVAFFVALPWLMALYVIVTRGVGRVMPAWTLAMLLLLPFLTVGFFALIPVMLYRNARSLRGAHTYEFTDQAIRLNGPGFDSRVEWSVVTRCWDTAGGLLFFSDKLAIISVPTRALSPPDRLRLKELAGAKGVELRGRV